MAVGTLAREFLADTLGLLGVVGVGEEASNEDLVFALKAFNKLLDSWSMEGLGGWANQRLAGTAPAYLTNISIYPTYGQISTFPPRRITHVAIQSVDGPDFSEIPVKICTWDEWSKLTQKDNLNSERPTHCYISLPTTDSEIAEIRLYPLQSIELGLILYAENEMKTGSSGLNYGLGSDITRSFPRGYEMSLQYNLAIDLATRYGKVLPPEVYQIAKETKDELKRNLIVPVKATSDLAPCGYRPNIYTGE